MASQPTWRNVALFVSSTFRDMHAERDHLAQVVFPELEERMRARRLSLEPIDLRWGVETASIAGEAEKELAVLRACLEEIERSRPFQIVLLGQRYGWVPSRERLEATTRAAGMRNVPPSTSVTALEIDAGLFGPHGADQRCFVYCRAPLPRRMPREEAQRMSDRLAGDKIAGGRLARLKAKLRQRLPGRVRQYRVQWDAERNRLSGLEAFGRMVLEDLWGELSVLYPTQSVSADVPEHERAREQVLDFFAQQARDFVGRQSLLTQLTEFAVVPTGAHWAVCLTGPAGSGKSAILAKLHATLATREVVLLAHAPGAAQRGSSVDALLRRWIVELGGTSAAMQEADPARLDEVFARRLEEVAAKRRVVLLLDALDQLEATDRARFLGWLPRTWPANARLIASAIAGEASFALTARAGVRLVQMSDLSAAEAGEIADALCRRHHRRLNEQVRAALLARASAGGMGGANALWLTLVVRYLNDLDADDFVRAEQGFAGNAEQRLLALLLDVVQRMPVALDALHRFLLEQAVARQGELARRFAHLIALGHFGWRERDFARLMPMLGAESWSELRFAQLRRNFRAHLLERAGSGRWDFAHRSARESLLAELAPESERRRELHRHIAAHLESLPEDDPVRVDQLMRHYVAGDMPEQAAAHLVRVSLPAAREAALQALAEANGEGEVDWICALLWSATLDLAERARLAVLLQEGLALEFARAGKTRAQASLLEAIKEFWRGRADRGDDEQAARYRYAHTTLGLGELYRRLSDTARAARALAEGAQSARQHLAAPRPVALLRERPADSPAPAPRPAAPDWESADWLELLALLQANAGDLLLEAGALREAQFAYGQVLSLDRWQTPRASALTDAREPLRRRADLALMQSRMGQVGLLEAMGHMAIGYFETALAALDQFQTLDPDNRAIARERALLRGRLSQALRRENAPKAAAIASAQAVRDMAWLVSADASNREWQVSLGYFHIWHGDAWRDLGQPARAKSHYLRSLGLIERVADADPDHSAWREALAQARSRLAHPALTAVEASAADDKASAARSLQSDYQRPAVVSSSDEERRVAGLDSSERERWREEARAGPAFGDWRRSLDRVQFAARQRAAAPFEQAYAALRARAQAGDAQAQHGYAEALLGGDAPASDRDEGLAWLRRAAEQGDAGAQYDLGVMLMASAPEAGEGLQWYARAAQQGHAHAQYNLGEAYAHGRGVARDAKTACAWWEKAAEQGLAEAQYNLGMHRWTGEGCAADPNAALAWLTRAAEQGFMQAQHNLGELLLEGKQCGRDLEAGLRWLGAAAAQGSPHSLHDLGAWHALRAQPPDNAAALRCYAAAAEAGLAKSAFAAGLLLLTGKGVERDVRGAMQWLQKGAQAGHPQSRALAWALAQAIEGQAVPAEIAKPLAESGDDWLRGALTALDEIAHTGRAALLAADQAAAQQGDAQAQYRLGVHWSQRARPPDFDAARDWYRRAADQGLAEAKYNLGYLYLLGQGVSADQDEGLRWIRAAATQGMAVAQYELGVFYAEGKLVPVDPAAAARWYRRAAEQGLPNAQHNLAHSYLAGNGVPADRAAARQWFERAAQQGFAPSQAMLLSMQSGDQRAEE